MLGVHCRQPEQHHCIARREQECRHQQCIHHGQIKAVFPLAWAATSVAAWLAASAVPCPLAWEECLQGSVHNPYCGGVANPDRGGMVSPYRIFIDQ